MTTTPTPHSDQAATTPIDEASARLSEQFIATRPDAKNMPQYKRQMWDDVWVVVTALRAQSAELLALRALLNTAMPWLRGMRDLMDKDEPLYDNREEQPELIAFIKSIDAALNSPTQKSPAK